MTATRRRNDIDWLRIIATYLLFVFHTAMVFNPAPFYHIRNAEVAFPVFILCGFIGLWHMPLFFVLAGWSMHSSLQRRGVGGFLRERFFRLFVPLVAACMLLMPVIKFLELKNGFDANFLGLWVVPELQSSFRDVLSIELPVKERFDESFLEFLPSFFTRAERFTWAHLWFVVYLLTFTLLYLPLYQFLSYAGSLRRRVTAWWVYAPILPLAVIQVFLRPHWMGLQNLYDDWANFAYYSTFLTVGYGLARYPQIETVLHAEWRRALAFAVASTLALLLATLGVFESQAVVLALTAVAGWTFIVAFLGIAHAASPVRTPMLDYLAESAFPVYLLHQTAIVSIGYALIQTALNLWIKLIVLLVLAVASTLLVYHVLIRPFALPRFLCGMKKLKGRPQPVAVRPVAVTLVLLAIASLCGSPSSASSPEGLWYAEGGAAKVEIARCGEALCGRVVWLRSPYDEDGCMLRDRHNPDPERRGRPVIGLEILRGLERSRDAADRWEGGTIYDPSSGRSYSLQMTVASGDRLELRGYIGLPLIGRTTRWFRVGTEEQTCRAHEDSPS